MKDKPALYQYLDDLLHDPVAGDPAARSAHLKVLYPKQFLEPSETDKGNVEERPEVEPETCPEPPSEAEASSGQEPDSPTHAQYSRPCWADQPFECLVFSVDGVSFAVPLVTLGSIHSLDRKLTHLPGQPDWFLGILHTKATGNLKVLDTARCVMPERYNSENRKDLQYVISIHGSEWALSCHTVEKSLKIQPDNVKWRQQRSQRPWLAGTVVELMCPLLDTDGFQDFLHYS